MPLSEMPDDKLIVQYRYYAGLLANDFVWMKRTVKPEKLNEHSEHRAYAEMQKYLPVFNSLRDELWRRKETSPCPAAPTSN